MFEGKDVLDETDQKICVFYSDDKKKTETTNNLMDLMFFTPGGITHFLQGLVNLSVRVVCVCVFKCDLIDQLITKST